jgi:hypothetical protein
MDDLVEMVETNYGIELPIMFSYAIIDKEKAECLDGYTGFINMEDAMIKICVRDLKELVKELDADDVSPERFPGRTIDEYLKWLEDTKRR